MLHRQIQLITPSGEPPSSGGRDHRIPVMRHAPSHDRSASPQCRHGRIATPQQQNKPLCPAGSSSSVSSTRLIFISATAIVAPRPPTASRSPPADDQCCATSFFCQRAGTPQQIDDRRVRINPAAAVCRYWSPRRPPATFSISTFAASTCSCVSGAHSKTPRPASSGFSRRNPHIAAVAPQLASRHARRRSLVVLYIY